MQRRYLGLILFLLKHRYLAIISLQHVMSAVAFKSLFHSRTQPCAHRGAL